MSGNSALYMCVLLWSLCSGVEEPELVFSLHQSAIKQEKVEECGAERKLQSQGAVTGMNEDRIEEKRERGTELQTDADLTLDFNTGTLINANIKLRKTGVKCNLTEIGQ